MRSDPHLEAPTTPPEALTVPLADRLCYRRAELPAVTGIPERTLYRAIHRGEFPPPDRRIGRVAVWGRDTITRWLAGGGSHK